MFGHKAKVGVVIPIWNVASYIERCAESLMNQTLDDMQFVFVDDASPDNSIEILNAMLARHPERADQVSVVHHTCNKGLPSARKTGLDLVNAEYVAHCDSDDWVEPNMYETMYLSACSNNADMVVCSANASQLVCGDDANLLKAFLHRKIYPVVWRRLTRTEIYRRVVFPKENYFEDWVQGVQTHAYSRVVNVVPELLYHYNTNPSSITNLNDLENCEERLRQSMVNMKMVQDFVISNHLATEDDLIYLKIRVRQRLSSKLMLRQGRKQYLNTYPEVNKALFHCHYLPLDLKIEHVFICLNLYPEWIRYGKSAYRHLQRLIR